MKKKEEKKEKVKWKNKHWNNISEFFCDRFFFFNPFGVESNLSHLNNLNVWGRDITLVHIT